MNNIINEIKNRLQCSIDGKYLTDAITTPCCGQSFDRISFYTFWSTNDYICYGCFSNLRKINPLHIKKNIVISNIFDSLCSIDTLLENLECPVDLDHYNNPIYLSCCGNSINHDSLVEFFNSQKKKHCPMCRYNLGNTKLVKNMAISEIISILADNNIIDATELKSHNVFLKYM